ncbi:MAG TPA: hypothetical protein VFK41_10435 [Nocardioidaceae bacterium]|nr:hypothetical protein [Nocardioidaceae bacterium]
MDDGALHVMPKGSPEMKMRRRVSAVVVGALVALLGPGVVGASTAGTSELPGPPLRQYDATVTGFQCPAEFIGAGKAVVLLVPGAGETPDDAWDNTLEYHLSQRGRVTCSLWLPEQGWVDVQRSVEYVVTAVRMIRSLTGRKVDVVGHGEGAFLATYALRYWPDLARKVDDVIGYAGTYDYGSEASAQRCAWTCPTVVRQLAHGSSLLRAVADHPLPGGPSYTAFSTQSDRVVTPQPRAGRLIVPGARNYVLQDLCPTSSAGHDAMGVQESLFGLMLDALGHAGPAERARAGSLGCGLLRAPSDSSVTVVPGWLDTSTSPSSTEPSLRCYVDPACAKPRLQPSLRARAERLTPTTYRAHGRLFLPPGATRQCAGEIVVRLLSNGRTVARRTTRLRQDCSFGVISAVPATGSLVLVTRFLGNIELRPAESPARTV